MLLGQGPGNELQCQAGVLINPGQLPDFLPFQALGRVRAKGEITSDLCADWSAKTRILKPCAGPAALSLVRFSVRDLETCGCHPSSSIVSQLGVFHSTATPDLRYCRSPGSSA